MATLEHLSTVVDADHPLTRAVWSARVEATGRADVATVFPAWTDAALLAHFAAIPCVVLGPGDLALAHSPRENVPLAEVAEAALIYSAAAVRFTSPGGRA